MRIVGSIALLLAFVLASSSAALAVDGLRILRSDETALELEWTLERPELVDVSGEGATFRRPMVVGAVPNLEPGRPDLPVLIEPIGLPWAGDPRVRVVSVDVATLSVPDLAPAPREVLETDDEGRTRVRVQLSPADREFPAGAWPARWAEVRGSTSVRGQRVGRLAIHPFRYVGGTGELQWARRLVIRIEYGEAGRDVARGGIPESAESDLLGDRLLNAEVARRWKKPRRAEPGRRGAEASFQSSSHWVKFPITSDGVYRIDYFTFQNLGYDPAAIDPRSIRVFAGSNLELPEPYNPPPPDFMTECALLDLGNGDDRFELEDRLLFYALDTQGWGSEYDSLLSRTDHVDHWYADETWYWVTWGGSFPDSPRRMATRSVPAGGGGTTFRTSSPHRLHFEQDNVDVFRYRGEDGWMWEDLNGRGRDRTYNLRIDRPASGDGFLQARMYSHQRTDRDPFRAVQLKIGSNPLPLTEWIWKHGTTSAQNDVTACFEGALGNGMNAIRVNVSTDYPQSLDHLYTGWFDLEYDRRLTALGGATLKFFAADAPPVLPTNVFVDSLRFESDTTIVTHCDPPPGLVYGSRDFLLEGFDADSTEIFFFDVSDQHAPIRLLDFTVSNPTAPHGIRFSDPAAPTATSWYYATTLEGVKPLAAGTNVTIRDLRATSNGAEYLVIHHPLFTDGAERLATLRSTLGTDPMRTMVVPIQEVYDQFAWGMTDPVAIRDFLANSYRSWGGPGGAPPFVALIGDAAYDSKGFLSGSPENLLPSFTRRYRTARTEYVSGDNLWFYSTDDFFGYIDEEDYELPGTIPGLDVAIGRFPIRDSETLDLMLDKIESYLRYEMAGQWQNRVILVADDERVLNEAAREPIHTRQVELLARTRFPPALDRVKIYLTEYPRNDFGKKPEAQEAFIEEFTRGGLMTTYTGHGDQATMAQEEVFVSQKIPELLNERRYTVFSTFSCTVSRFDLLSGDSMAEQLLYHEDGGAVTTFASGGLVYPTQSSLLNQEWLSGMYGTPYLIPTYSRHVRSIGRAAVLAKSLTAGDVGTLENDEKYVLLGDPALQVRFGRSLIQFESATVDSQFTEGLVRVVRGTVHDEDGNVMDGSNGQPPFRGTAYVHVTENADDSGYDYFSAGGTPLHIDYVLEGVTTYRGEIPVEDGRFTAKFHLSEGVEAGNRGRISVFALSEDQLQDASGAYDSLRIEPTIFSDQVDDQEGPGIVARFEGYDNFVDGDYLFTDKPVLNIFLEDPSGINLRPFPQYARLEAELDGRDRIDLAEDFSYEKGMFTQGKVRRIFSLAPGPHRLEIKAFDNVGNRSSIVVRFTIVLPDADFDLVDQYVTVYPNPFRHRADFVLRLTHDADVTLKVFTIAGRKVYETVESFFVTDSGGRVLGADHRIRWDGTDDNGRPLANGTYLYKLEAVGADDEGNRRSDEFVGHVVRMR